MISLLLKMITTKGVLSTLVEAAKIAKAARDVMGDSRGGRGNPPARVAGADPRDRLAADFERMQTLVAEQARLLEMAAAQIERLAIEVRRATLRGTLGLGAGIVALLLAVLALVRG